MREGYSEELYIAAYQNLARWPDNRAARLALAVSAVKSGDRKASSEAVNRALESAPNDPIALMYAGNASFLAGSATGMEGNYGAVIKSHPQYAAEAKFSLAQAYMGSGGFTAADMISEAAKINSSLIGGYMRENAHYFGEGAPPLRSVMQPTLTPSYFWGRLFFADPKDAFAGAGITYYGLTPIAAFALSAALMTVFLIVYYAAWSKESKIKKYFTCRICGRLLCRKCRKGTMCSVCYRKNIDSHNNAATMYNLQKKYQDRATIQKDLIKCALGIAVPGAGALYKGETVFKPAAVMFISSAVFAAYYCAATFHASYPSKSVANPIYFVLILLVYNAAAIIRQCLGLAATMKVRAKMLVKPN
jgi:tetratricopeptide (TPR) repeat protein